MKSLPLLIFFIFLFSSCNDEMETDGQLAAKKLKADIGAANIQNILVVSIYDGSRIFSGSSYSITSDGFIVVATNTDKATFNLREMKSYQLSETSLTLYY